MRENLSYAEALPHIERMNHVGYRPGWNGREMFIKLKHPCIESDMTEPYIFMKTADEKLVPWLCSQTDALATDWTVVPFEDHKQTFTYSEGMPEWMQKTILSNSPHSESDEFNKIRNIYKPEGEPLKMYLETVMPFVRNGQVAYRRSWLGSRQYIEYQYPDEHSKMTDPYLYLRTSNHQLIPWEPSQIDLNATDWECCHLRDMPHMKYPYDSVGGSNVDLKRDNV